MDSDYEALHRYGKCQHREKLFKDTRAVYNLKNGSEQTISIRFNQPSNERIWYLYLYSCKGSFRSETQDEDLRLHLDILMINNDSHFSGEEDSMLWIYLTALVLAISLIPNNFKKLRKDIQE